MHPLDNGSYTNFFAGTLGQRFPDSSGSKLTVDCLNGDHGHNYDDNIRQPGEDPQTPPDPFGVVVKRCNSQNKDR